MAITICSVLPHSTRSLSSIVHSEPEGPKCNKDTLKPDIQANAWPMQFFKSQFHRKKQKESCKEIQA
jgi:hypothetical protein